MSHALVLRAAQFQAAWYFSLLLAVILLVVGVGSAYALGGARGLWRSGEHGPAAVIVAAVVFGLAALLGMYVVGIGGLLTVRGSS